MKQYENDVERYLDEIRQLLPVSKEKKERFLENFAEDIARHEEEVGTTVDYEGLVTYFGTPATIARDYASVWKDELTDIQTVNAAHVPWRKIAFWLCVALLFGCVAWLVYDFIVAIFTYDSDYFFLTVQNRK